MPSTILDSRGNPFPTPSAPRQDLSASQPPQRAIHASFDAAGDSTEFQNYWAAADALNADSAHSRAVRSRLVSRSRYEVGNNGYTDGMVQTHANYLISKGPTLRMQTNSKGFNALVEDRWKRWCKAVKLRRKMWCMAHAKVQDGEAFGLIRTNPGIRHEVKMDLVLMETEQCQTPMLPYDVVGYIDGIRFDEFDNPLWYDILPHHPGGHWDALNQKPEQVPAKFMLHWFQLRRPGQHRAVPEFRSTLQVGAGSRRMREATLGAVESAASWDVLLKTQMSPDVITDQVAPMSTLPLQKRMMVAMPMGWDASQMRSEHPNATYESFNKSQISEQGRPKSMPYNVAACDSSGYNYASGRLDHQTYFGSLDIERLDADDLLLDPLFELWFDEAAAINGWVNIPDMIPPHVWDWPKHPVADVKAEAQANDTKLRNGSMSLSRQYAEAGLDFEDEVEQMAKDYGVSVDEMRAMLRKQIFNAGANQAPTIEEDDEQAD